MLPLRTKCTVLRPFIIIAFILITTLTAVSVVIVVRTITKPIADNLKPTAIIPQPAILKSVIRPSLPLPAGFTLQDKIGQLLVVGVTDQTVAKDLEANYQIGGFLLMKESNLFSKVATDAIKQAGELPPLFAIDQEGGFVSRLPDKSFLQDTAKYMGGLTPTQIRQIGDVMGEEMVAIGVSVDFAPVVDLDDGHNAAISIFGRSFSNNPTIVAQKALAFANGLKQAGVVPTFKHFPGLGYATGATDGNTDTGMATSPPLSSLEQYDLKPYETVLRDNTTSAVMVGNQIVPDLTDGAPASLSPRAYALLRSRYHFSQVVFTDELASAKAIAKIQPSPAEAVIAALNAGADMPLINIVNEDEASTIISDVARAVQEGRLNMSQIDASLLHVLQLKKAISTQ